MLERYIKPISWVLIALWVGAIHALAFLFITEISEPAPVVIVQPAPRVQAQRPSSQIHVSQRQLDCLAKNLYHEARGEGREGMLAVARVTQARLAAGRWGKSLCRVVYARAQFSWTRKEPPIREPKAWRQAQQIAREALVNPGHDPSAGSLYYVHHRLAGKKRWMRGLVRTARVGNHVFYRPA